MMQRLARHLPCLEWGKQYNKAAAAKQSHSTQLANPILRNCHLSCETLLPP